MNSEPVVRTSPSERIRRRLKADFGRRSGTNFAEGAVVVKPLGSSGRYDTVNIVKDSLIGSFLADEFGWYHDALSSRDEGAFYICAENITNVCTAKSSVDLDKTRSRKEGENVRNRSKRKK